MSDKQADHDAAQIAKQVGSTLRSIRQERGLSLQALAEWTGVSKLTLGKIERGEANPSLSVIWKIANGLTIPISALLTESEDIQLSRRHEGNKVVSANDACTLEPMFDAAHHGSLEIHRAYLEPDSEYAPGSHQAGVVEYVTVMQGEVIIKLQEKEYHLYEHDAIKFNGDREHAYINPTNAVVVLHFTMTYS
ncbi:helix-turn-helix domain-containing protein [Salsuginibacillus kocurii]|uniref:helix-turn-helix domain-containing protein n=1 Tax=Salsuginibacillus kocurii TaxID=427078 RepID=UPI00037BEECF|nr:XRE family transcriptional regulator [Salsuginibacillus kocurii]